MSERQEDRLERALRSLPRVAAGEEFTPRLVARFGRRPPRPASWTRPLWVAAALVAVLALSGVFGLRRQRLAERDYADRVERLRQETLRLSQDFSALRAMAADAPPVLYLAGDDRVELVLDLGQRPAAGAAPAAARPARYDETRQP